MNCLFCPLTLPLNEKEIWNHYLNAHSFTRKSDKLYHYIQSILKPANSNFFFCTECRKEYFNNRAYYAHLFGAHPDIDVQYAAGFDDVTQEVLSDDVKTKRVYKNTLNFREADLEPAETLNYALNMFEQNLNTRYADNPANNQLTMYIDAEVVYKKVNRGQLVQIGIPQNRVTRTVTINKVPHRAVLTKFQEELQTNLLNTHQNASNWKLYRINSMSLYVTDDSLLSSGVILNIVGGKHTNSEFIESEAKDVNMSENQSDEEMPIETQDDLDFIDDTDINPNVTYYQQMENNPDMFLLDDDTVIEPDENEKYEKEDELKKYSLDEWYLFYES